MNRRRFLSISITALSARHLAFDAFSQTAHGSASLDPSLRAKAVASLEKGLAYLKKSQKPEGFWSTADYPGLTSLVIQAFAGAPDGKHRGSSTIREGLKFIRKKRKARWRHLQQGAEQLQHVHRGCDPDRGRRPKRQRAHRVRSEVPHRRPAKEQQPIFQ